MPNAQGRRPLRPMLFIMFLLVVATMVWAFAAEPAHRSGTLLSYQTFTAPLVRRSAASPGPETQTVEEEELGQGARPQDDLEYPEDKERVVQGVIRVPRNSTVVQTRGQKTPNLPLAALGPPWTSCIVESWEAGRNVLEEWIMRDERSSIRSFRAWRQSGPDPVSMRCEPVLASDTEEVTCLECIAPGQGRRKWFRGLRQSWGDDGGRMEVVSVNSNLRQCMERSVAGSSFCKRGTVAAEN